MNTSNLMENNQVNAQALSPVVLSYRRTGSCHCHAQHRDNEILQINISSLRTV